MYLCKYINDNSMHLYVRKDTYICIYTCILMKTRKELYNDQKDSRLFINLRRTCKFIIYRKVLTIVIVCCLFFSWSNTSNFSRGEKQQEKDVKMFSYKL